MAYFWIDAKSVRGAVDTTRARERRTRELSAPGRTSPRTSRRGSTCGSATSCPGRDRHRQPPLLRRGDGCRAPLDAALAAGAVDRARGSAAAPRRRAGAARRRQGRARGALAAAEGLGVRLAARLLRDDGSLRERRSVERPRAAHGRPLARRGSTRPTPGYFHGGDLKGLTGTCDDPRTGLARIKELGFTALWVTPAVVQRTVQGYSAAYHGYWGLDFTRSTRTSAPRPTSRRSSTARTGSG